MTATILLLAVGPTAPVAGRDSTADADAGIDRTEGGRYPAHWWAPVPASERQWWEILPQDARRGEVVLSKRHELGQLSNFATTPFSFRGHRYASLEGLWQSMKYPEGPDDPRAQHPDIDWPHTRAEVAGMVSFAANAAGQRADELMARLGIDWLTFEGERIHFMGADRDRHYEIIEAATRAKLRQNPEIEPILRATGDLILMPDHITDPNAPPAWRYHEIWMKLRSELSARD